MSRPDVLDRLVRAQNAHDIDAFVDCFDPAYRSEQPAHPGREFTGNDQVRRNWTALFDAVPDLRSDVIRWALDDDVCWVEWRWHGTRRDGTPLDMRGTTIFGIQNDRIIWGRLYMSETVTAPETITESIATATHSQNNPD